MSDLNIENIEKDLSTYNHLLNFAKLKSEIPDYILNKSINKENNNFNTLELSKKFIEEKQNIFYPEIFKVFKIYLSIPISSSEAERSFSCLKRIKTWLRNTTGQSRLSSLAILNIESQALRNIDLDKVVEDFGSKNDTRKTYFF